MIDQLYNLLNAIADDYKQHAESTGWVDDLEMGKFLANLSFEKGTQKQKYCKIIKSNNRYESVLIDARNDQRMVWGFVVKEDDKQFKRGDILLAKDWNAPYRKESFGNILEENFSMVHWEKPAKRGV